MAKKMKGSTMGYKSKTVGGALDGARKSQKGQTTALLKANKAPGGRMKRMAKMERMDGPV